MPIGKLKADMHAIPCFPIRVENLKTYIQYYAITCTYVVKLCVYSTVGGTYYVRIIRRLEGHDLLVSRYAICHSHMQLTWKHVTTDPYTETRQDDHHACNIYVTEVQFRVH